MNPDDNSPNSGMRDVVFALALVGTVALLVLPIPSFFLDILLSLSMCIALVMFLLVIQVEKPLQFSTFPTVLLSVTLYRLALNVATTRLILGHGSEGESAAGQVVRTFGNVLLGGNYVLGVVIFLILIVINFIVITKGAGRIAEVSARFTLDSLPGKQMSIDAELNAGHINEKEAKARRKELERETDFYGSMDGASKFVRGDAVAAIVITVINIIGGLIIGVFQQNMDIARAAKIYTVLSVGDGLVSQIPALLISAGAGMLVTRASSGDNLSRSVTREILGYSKPLFIGAGILGLLAVVPGMPHLSYGGMALAMMMLGRNVAQSEKEMIENAKKGIENQKSNKSTPRNEIEEALPVNLLELEVGYELIALVDAAKSGDLLKRISIMRKQFAHESGLIVPAINVRDNLNLKPSEYRLLLSGNEIGRYELKMGRIMTMNPSGLEIDIAGDLTREPAFGIDAKWINTQDRERAENLGYTVVEPSAVITTHLTELIRQNAHELLGRKEAQQLFDLFSQQSPKLIEELIPAVMPAGEVVKVLKQLLREGQSIRDLRTILEALLDFSSQTKDIDTLTENVRQRMARHISSRFKSVDGKIYALFLDPKIEDAFRQLMRSGNAPANEMIEFSEIMKAMESSFKDVARNKHMPLIVTAPDVRRGVLAFITRHFPGISVISFKEVDSNTPLQSLGMISIVKSKSLPDSPRSQSGQAAVSA